MSEQDFWGQTPKRFVIHMRAADKREAVRRIGIAEAVCVGTQAKSHRDVAHYADSLLSSREPLPPEAMDGALRAAANALPKIDRQTFLSGMRSAT